MSIPGTSGMPQVARRDLGQDETSRKARQVVALGNGAICREVVRARGREDTDPLVQMSCLRLREAK